MVEVTLSERLRAMATTEHPSMISCVGMTTREMNSAIREAATIVRALEDRRLLAWSFLDRLDDGPLRTAFQALSDDDKSEAVDQLEDAINEALSNINREGL